MPERAVTYVLPIRCSGACDGHQDLANALADLRAASVEVLVADGSPDATRDGPHRRAFTGHRLLAVRPRPGTNGKVAGVRAGVLAASHDRVVIADDDVRYDVAALDGVAALLDHAELVVPQNHFVGPLRWHSVWDTGRTLLNRAVGHDYPGTLAVRREVFLRSGGYDDDVLFENLELIRTVSAGGGRIRWAPELYVPRVPPDTRTFLGQRVRQAYDDLAQPARLVAELAIAPAILWSVARRPRALAWGAVAVVATAEVGRRRHGGRRRFPVVASIAAPAWVLERAACVWAALAARLVFGGISYGGGRLRRAASSPRSLRRRLGRPPERPRARRRTAASSATGRTGRAARPGVGSRAPFRPRPRPQQAL